MKAILHPAVLLMNRLRFRTKFILIVVLCMVPLGLMSVTLLAKLDEDVVFAAQERKGVEYLGPLRNLMVHIAETRGMTNALLNGDESFRAKIEGKRQAADADLQQLAELDQRLGSELRTGDGLERIRRTWEGLKGTAFSMTPETSFKAHTDLIAEVMNFVARVADASNLILDPELDSFYLMDAAVTRIPKMADVMGQVRGLGAGVAAAGELDPEMKLHLAVLGETIRQNFTALTAGLATAYEVNPTIKARLGAASDKAVADSERFISLVQDKILDATRIDLDSKAFFAAGTAAIGGNLALFDALLPALDALLAARIDRDNQTKYTSVAVMVVVLLLLAYMLAGFYVAIHQSLGRLKECALEIAQGDLTVYVELDSRDEMAEIAASVNAIADGMQRAVLMVAATGENLVQTARRLAQANAQTAQGVQTQQQEIDLAATAINEMTATVADVAGNMSRTANAVQEASQAAGKGRQVVSQTVQSINALAEEVRNAAEVMRRLEGHSSNINSIVDVIRGIADQTNLLALNAAIEAARAGEQGRGFAVVADEVRTLAQRTQDSTHEIQAMIERLQNDTQNAVQVMLKGDQCANTSVEQAAIAGQVLDDINANVLSISDMSTQVASASEEQSAVADEINHNIIRISQVAEQTAHDQEISSGETARVSSMAEELHSLLKRFRVDVSGASKAGRGKRGGETAQGSALLVWSDTYSVGYEEIDRQHQRLVGMINELHEGVTAGHGENALERVLQGLIAYTVNHFQFEETLMEKYGFSELAAHKAQHHELRKQVLEYKRRWDGGDRSVMDELLGFLKNWLGQHIQGTDKKLGVFLSAKERH